MKRCNNIIHTTIAARGDKHGFAQYVYRARQKALATLVLAMLAAAMPCRVAAQSIVTMDVDTEACLGDTVALSIGFEPWRNIVLRNGVATLGSTSHAFLPDGVVCDGKCSYESPVVFTDFTPGATLTSVEDLLYVRLKIEHSFLGDIYMGIKCPNGQRASLMNWAGTGSSPCTDSVPASHRGWNSTYPNAGGGVFLGEAYDYTNSSHKCDSSAENNEPGIGWNYCWSNNTTQGYTYAPQDGLIYRSVNVVSHYNTLMSSAHSTIDSSDVAAGTNFYHPDQSFSNLVGCPLNGRWTIEVIDAYSSDNGYIFEWEMALNPTLLPNANAFTGQEVRGSEVTVYTDSTFGISAPPETTGDTTLPYQVYIFTTNGDTIDTAFNVHYYRPYETHIDDTLCHGDTAWWLGMAVTDDTSVMYHGTTIHGCDSIVEVRYTFNATYDIADTHLFCPRGIYTYLGHDYGGPVAFDTMMISAEGCDSLVHVALVNSDTTFDLRIFVSADDSMWSDDTTLYICHPGTVWLRDTTPNVVERQWLLGDGDTVVSEAHFGHTYDSVGLFSLRLTAVNHQGCTDTAWMLDAVGVLRTPEAAFEWGNPLLVTHDATTPLLNLTTPTGDSLDYYWEIQNTTGGTDTSTLFQPTYCWSDGTRLAPDGDYAVTLTASITYLVADKDTVVCPDTTSRTIAIIDDYLQFPNLVTPNGDGVNDTWVVVNMLECGIYTINELWVFNRWGIEVYHVRNISREDDFWDPAATNSPDGSYYYRFMARSPFGTIKRNGTIEVMRGQ